MDEFPFSDKTILSYSGLLPERADVVVIGGGVIGVCTALFLSRAGHRVVLLEKGVISGEQSSRNWGWIRQQGRDPDELPIMVEANRLWRELAQETNADIGLTRGGVTYLAETDAALQDYANWLPYAAEHGVDTRLLSKAETAAMLPGISKSYKGALYTASDMKAEPWKAVPALAELAARTGARIVEGCAVRCLDVAAGRVAGVVTEKGCIKAPEVVLAGGAWSALFLSNEGIRLPQLSVRATAVATTSLPVVAPGGVTDDSLAFRPRADGGYTLAAGGFHELFVGPAAFRCAPKYLTQLSAHPAGTRFMPFAPKGYPDSWGVQRRWNGAMETPFERMRVLNPEPNRAKVAELKGGFAKLYPELPEFDIRCAWAGMIDTMPDVIPVVDRVDALPGLTIGTGMCGHGFGIGPGMGRVLAALATGQEVGHNLARFRLNRFSDGSPMVLGPAL